MNTQQNVAAVAAHTPGPWTAVIADTFVRVCRQFVPAACRNVQVHTIADCKHDFIPQAERVANARLIAAAPDLLAACRLMLEAECRNGYGAALRERAPETLDEHHAVYLNGLDAIGKAIATAEGRAS